jgi:hypothetical protein
MAARRAIKFVDATNLENLEYALNDALAELSTKAAADIRLNMHIGIGVVAPYILAIDYETDEPWPPAEQTE